MTTTPWLRAICCALISPLITLQCGKQSPYTMILLLHGLTMESRGKQCVWSMRSNNNLYVYTIFFELLLNFAILEVLLIEHSSKHGWNL